MGNLALGNDKFFGGVLQFVRWGRGALKELQALLAA